MGGISVGGGGHGGKKAVDSSIPLVPFIDLLLCCVMFLLVTAVWNDLASVPVTQRLPGASLDAPESPSEAVTLSIHADGYELSTRAGDRQQIAGGEPSELTRA